MAAEEWVGRVIDQRYVVESGLGAGGMGVVLRAKHRFTGQTVALKVLKPELSNDPAIQSRFLAEAQAPNAIGHPGIVRVHDAGRDPTGFLYLVMELLEGRSLRVPMVRGQLGPLDASRIMLELLDALGTAHARGFVHRDLKPDNVFLVAPHDSVKLLDFGIAKVLDVALARVRTATGITMGTPAYMSPEQLSDAAGVDARTDLWACGVIVYEMLCGRLPFRGDRPEQLLVAIATQNPDPIRAYLPQAPPELDAFFARAMSRDPRMRFGAAAEMAHALTKLPLQQLRPAVAAAGPQMTPPASYAASHVASHATPAGHAAAPGYHASVAAAATPMPPAQHATPLPQHPQHATPLPQHANPQHANPQYPNPPHASPDPRATPMPHASPDAQHGAPRTQSPTAPPPHTAPPSTRTRTSTRPPPAKKSSPATLIVGIAAAAAVVVLVVLLVTKKSGSNSSSTATPGSGSGSGSAVAIAARSDGSATVPAGSAVTPPPPTTPSSGGIIPSGDLGASGSLKSRLEKIAGGEAGSATKPPMTTPTAPATPPSTTPKTPVTTPTTTTKSPPVTAPAAAEGNVCDKGCRAAARCGLAPNHAACLAECNAKPETQPCYARAASGDCAGAAACALAQECGVQPSGTSGCRDVFACQIGCLTSGGGQACACSCAGALRPSESAKLVRALGCIGGCADEACMMTKCKAPIEACTGEKIDAGDADGM